MASVYMDTSDLDKLLGTMRTRLTAGQFDKLMRRTLHDVGRHTRAVTKREIPHEYEVDGSFVNKGVKNYKITGGGGNLQCDIPVIGAKGHIGGTFPAMGGWYGWNPPTYTIQAKIVKGKISKLPGHMNHQGGQPPYRNMGGGTGVYVGKKDGKTAKQRKALGLKYSKHPEGTPGTLVYTRSGPAFRAKIHSVSGLSVAQMPMNRAKPAIERDIDRYGIQRAEHHFSFLFG